MRAFSTIAQSPIRTIVLIAFLTFITTTLFFPTKRPGVIFGCGPNNILKNVKDVTIVSLVPLFGKPGDKLYAIPVAPSFDRSVVIDNKVQKFCLGTRPIILEDGSYGEKYKDGTFGPMRLHFAIDYWFFICFVPSIILGIAINLVLIKYDK